MSKRKFKMSPHQQKIMGEILRGGALRVEYVEGEEVYSIANGPRVGAATVRPLIINKFLQPVGDGLFGDTQTYRPVSENDAA